MDLLLVLGRLLSLEPLVHGIQIKDLTDLQIVFAEGVAVVDIPPAVAVGLLAPPEGDGIGVALIKGHLHLIGDGVLDGHKLLQGQFQHRGDVGHIGEAQIQIPQALTAHQGRHIGDLGAVYAAVLWGRI